MKSYLLTIALALLAGSAWAQNQDKQNKALLKAAKKADITAMEDALAEGADVNTTDNKGHTPLTLLLDNWGGVTEEVAFLAEQGADVNHQDAEGYSPLAHVVTAEVDAVAMAEILLAAGADPNSAKMLTASPLYLAVEANKPELVQLYIDHGADVSVVNDFGYTVLHFSTALGLGEITAMIAQAGVTAEAVAAIDSEGHTSLHHAAKHPATFTSVEALIAIGVPLDVLDDDGYTAVRLAMESSMKGHAEGCASAAALVAAGASLDHSIRKNETDLDLAQSIVDCEPLTVALAERGLAPAE